EYWRAVHRREREAKTHSLIVDPSQSPAWWAALETTDALPADFKSHCIKQADRYQQWLKNDAKNPKGKPFVAEAYSRTASGCGKAIEAAQSMPGWDFRRPPLAFKSGPGGKVQLRFVAELPCELRAEDRALIVQNFTDYLASFAKDENGNNIGLMYTAVIHAPDAHNDRRNYHLHIIAHPRPAKFLPEHNAWDFEVAEQFDHKGEVRKHAFYNNAIAGGDFIPHLRAKFTEINNAVLKARGIQRKLDPRRYEEMGITRTPTLHLGTRAAALEAMGVPTVVGRLNAIAIWGDAE
ncbi:MAG: MobA/MobL family protein, partial [Novosphingobium sp.]